ncbi:MAG: S8 family serine peptidase, partial [Candidatus Zipacnadales bacterium]
MTLFLHTGAVGLKARAFITSVVAAVIVMSATCPAWSASPADLAGPLRDLVALDTANQLTPANPLARMVHVQGGKVLVEVLCNGSASAHVATLQQLGATVDKCRDRRAQIVVPVSRLMDIALLPNVAQVRVPPYGMPEQIGPTVSEGVQLTNALSLQMAGITGLGASVAIIDAGFLGYTGAELPASVTARSFRADGIIDGITDHGTAVAEIVADMAPNATMYLLAVATTMDAESAFEWCLQNDIDIVTLSLGWVEGPFDGTHSLDRVVDRVRAGGVLPVKSSGNRAQQHWMGEWLDSDGDRLLEFAKSDEGIGIVTTTANEPIVVNLSWYETAGPTGAKAEVTDRDYDLELVDGTGQVIARSAVTQNGDDPPSETLYAYAPTPGQYDIRVRAVSSNIATGPTEAFQLFSSHDVDTALQVPETSLTIPGAASGIVTVGATRAVADLPDPIIDYPVDTLEPFSSQGPTVDGRQKPELSAPDGVQTSTSQNPFLGTSAAAPHVAGAAALLKSEDGTRTADELATVLVRLATEQNLIAPIKLPSGTNAQPPQCGAGRVSLRSGLDTKPPTISITFPVNGSTITTATPTIVGVVKDSETGVDAGTIVMTVDGTEVQWDSFTPGSGVVTYTPPAPLSRSSHTVTLVASDMVGNEGEAAVSNFRVGLPTLSAGLHMISLPFCNLTITNPAIIFGVNLDEFAQVRWVATDAAFNKYRIYP